jgi:hypothetical protein
MSGMSRSWVRNGAALDAKLYTLSVSHPDAEVTRYTEGALKSSTAGSAGSLSDESRVDAWQPWLWFARPAS